MSMLSPYWDKRVPAADFFPGRFTCSKFNVVQQKHQNNSWNLFKSLYNKGSRTTTLTYVVLLSLLFNLNRLHLSFSCFYCWLWTCKCLLSILNNIKLTVRREIPVDNDKVLTGFLVLEITFATVYTIRDIHIHLCNCLKVQISRHFIVDECYCAHKSK